LRRDNLIYQIEQFSNETIEEIYRLQLECADKLQKNEQKRNGESIVVVFNVLEDKFWSKSEIQRQSSCGEDLLEMKELKQQIDKSVQKYKLELRGNRSYKLIFDKNLKISDIVGLITNYDSSVTELKQV